MLPRRPSDILWSWGVAFFGMAFYYAAGRYEAAFSGLRPPKGWVGGGEFLGLFAVEPGGGSYRVIGEAGQT